GGDRRVYELPIPEDAPSVGTKEAPITVQFFADFECPFSRRAWPAIQRLPEEFPTEVRIVWRNYPLPYHEDAFAAAEASLEVLGQKGAEAFWKYHEKLIQNRCALTKNDLEKYAKELRGVRMDRFRHALDQHIHRDRVKTDIEAVRRSGLNIGTPSI